MHSGAQLEYEAPSFEKHSPTDSESDSDSEEGAPQEQLIHDVRLEFAQCSKNPDFQAFGVALPPGTSSVGRRQSADVTVQNKRVSSDHLEIVVGPGSVALRQRSDKKTRVRDCKGRALRTLKEPGAMAIVESGWEFELGSDRIKCRITFSKRGGGREAGPGSDDSAGSSAAQGASAEVSVPTANFGDLNDQVLSHIMDVRALPPPPGPSVSARPES